MDQYYYFWVRDALHYAETANYTYNQFHWFSDWIKQMLNVDIPKFYFHAK